MRLPITEVNVHRCGSFSCYSCEKTQPSPEIRMGFHLGGEEMLLNLCADCFGAILAEITRAVVELRK